MQTYWTLPTKKHTGIADILHITPLVVNNVFKGTHFLHQNLSNKSTHQDAHFLPCPHGAVNQVGQVSFSP